MVDYQPGITRIDSLVLIISRNCRYQCTICNYARTSNNLISLGSVNVSLHLVNGASHIEAMIQSTEKNHGICQLIFIELVYHVKVKASF